MQTREKTFRQKRFTVLQFITLSLLLSVIIPFIATSSFSAAPDWKPTQTVRIVVGTSPGSGSDRLARTMQSIWQKAKIVDADIIVENKPGGGGSISWAYLNQHAGDGHYIETSSPTLLTRYITGKSKVTYTDFTPLAILSYASCIFAVNVDSPIKTGKDFTDRLRKDPKSLSIGIASSRGNHNHIAAALVASKIGVNINELKIVVFDSSSKVMVALLGGHVDVGVSPAKTIASQKEAGKLRAIAVAGRHRLSGVFADVPTWKEQGIDAVAGNNRTMIGPKGLSQAQIAYWDGVFAKFTQSKDWKTYLKKEFSEDTYLNSKDAKVFLAEEYNRFKDILTKLGLAK